MFPRLLLAFITIPLLELYLLFKLGSIVGATTTICLVIMTGILGATLAKSQGYSILTRMQEELRLGRPPTDELIEGMLVLAGGVVLLTPGILTDIAGFSLMVPAFRRKVRNGLKKKLAEKTMGNLHPKIHPDNNDDDVIEV